MNPTVFSLLGDESKPKLSQKDHCSTTDLCPKPVLLGVISELLGEGPVPEQDPRGCRPDPAAALGKVASWPPTMNINRLD